MAWYGSEGQARKGWVRRAVDRSGMAGEAWCGREGRGWNGHGTAGEAGRVEYRRG